MAYQVLASDYDGTLSLHGQVPAEAIAALQRWKATGRQFVLVTGRLIEQLREVFHHMHLCDLIVAENGGIFYLPATQQQHIVGEPPPPALVQALRERGAEPLVVGQVMVATRQPHDATVREVLQELGLAWEIIMNRREVMLLPAGVHKASGMRAAFAHMGYALEATVGVGDAENDYDLLDSCAYRVAVANALPALQQHVDLVTQGEHGYGVAELITMLLAKT